ncbi:DUF1611 domain-containing protein [Neptunicella marina]|uniref:DUF1611 domain-containing protein n=1 Tax=Neptunicella marina TaxID=2125989 RepID=A0A8J6ISQ5_9ALTE|nr:DUF1611 domain-containing protein [Neptunicella marina]MBC3765614.1 DUF1611 domain-containing protein [Neptunicella marina]
MNQITTIKLNAPYLIFLGEVTDAMSAKTGAGLVQWCPEKVAGQLRTHADSVDLGVPDMTVEQAVAAGAKSLVIGVALVGGEINRQWAEIINQAAASGLDIVSGLHTPLGDVPGLVETAANSGIRLINVRRAPENLPVGNGKKRSGKRVLMVGTDCAVGKKYTALALTKALNEAGVQATFRATGQTGMMIAGEGIPIDSVKSDFISGAAELISPGNDTAHWDVIEGQGSLFNPSYAGVSLGLLHGSQPDAIVLCHDASRQIVSSCADYVLPAIDECIDLHLRCARLTNPAVICIGVSVNTSGLPADQRDTYLHELSLKIGLPCVDPLVEECELLVQQLNQLNSV